MRQIREELRALEGHKHTYPNSFIYIDEHCTVLGELNVSGVEWAPYAALTPCNWRKSRVCARARIKASSPSIDEHVDSAAGGGGAGNTGGQGPLLLLLSAHVRLSFDLDDALVHKHEVFRS